MRIEVKVIRPGDVYFSNDRRRFIDEYQDDLKRILGW